MSDVLLWILRVVAALPLAGVLMTLGRDLRAARGATFRARPSTGQRLTGRYTPSVSLIVVSPSGHVPAAIRRVSYPDLEIIVSVPRRARLRSAPDGARVVTSDATGVHGLASAGADAATRDVLVFVPARFEFGRAFVARLVAALVDPFVGIAVARVAFDATRGALGALDAETWSIVQSGRFAIGGPVIVDGEPFAIGRNTYEDAGGLDAASPVADTELGLRLYTRGFAVAYVDEAVALTSARRTSATARTVRTRIAGRRRLWRRLRRPLFRTKVLDGPEKSDVRWLLRGAPVAAWLAAGWVAAGALRLADTSWAPEVLGGLLLAATFATPLRFTHALGALALRRSVGRRRLLALLPALPLLAPGAMWTVIGSYLRGSGRRDGVSVSQDRRAIVTVVEPEPEPEPEVQPEPEPAPEVPPEPEPKGQDRKPGRRRVSRRRLRSQARGSDTPVWETRPPERPA